MDESAENPQVKSVEIVCGHCGNRMKSPINFRLKEHFETAKLIGIEVECLVCGKFTEGNKENIIIHYIDASDVGGGHVGRAVLPKSDK